MELEESLLRLHARRLLRPHTILHRLSAGVLPHYLLLDMYDFELGRMDYAHHRAIASTLFATQSSLHQRQRIALDSQRW